MNRVRNDKFNSISGFDRGRSAWVMALWQILKWFFFRTAFPWPSNIKVCILRSFGAKVGNGVYIKPQVNIHLPWKLEIGDHAWLGEEAFLLNFEFMKIGAHACISQRAFLCGGNHDFRNSAMRYRNGPIIVEEGAWVGAQVFIAPGVTVGKESVISAGSVLLKDSQPGRIYSGNPAELRGWRWKT